MTSLRNFTVRFSRGDIPFEHAFGAGDYAYYRLAEGISVGSASVQPNIATLAISAGTPDIRHMLRCI
jgi:hypothetical protein